VWTYFISGCEAEVGTSLNTIELQLEEAEDNVSFYNDSIVISG
jgi:hypothetical protein